MTSDTHHRGSTRRNVVNDNGNGPAPRLTSQTEHKKGNTMKKFGFATAVALSLGSLGIFASAGTAAADGLDAHPELTAVIDANGTHEAPDTGSYDELTQIGDADGFQSYITSSYPAASSWPG
jgi:hypothetical protein